MVLLVCWFAVIAEGAPLLFQCGVHMFCSHACSQDSSSYKRSRIHCSQVVASLSSVDNLARYGTIFDPSVHRVGRVLLVCLTGAVVHVLCQRIDFALCLEMRLVSLPYFLPDVGVGYPGVGLEL